MDGCVTWTPYWTGLVFWYLYSTGKWRRDPYSLIPALLIQLSPRRWQLLQRKWELFSWMPQCLEVRWQKLKLPFQLDVDAVTHVVCCNLDLNPDFTENPYESVDNVVNACFKGFINHTPIVKVTKLVTVWEEVQMSWIFGPSSSIVVFAITGSC